MLSIPMILRLNILHLEVAFDEDPLDELGSGNPS
jgi:hypothetical protein